MTNPNLSAAVIQAARKTADYFHRNRWHGTIASPGMFNHLFDLLQHVTALDAAAPVVELYCDDPRDTPAARRAVLDAAERGGDADTGIPVSGQDDKPAESKWMNMDWSAFKRAMDECEQRADKLKRDSRVSPEQMMQRYGAAEEEKLTEISEEMIDAAMIAYDECYRVNFEAIRGPMTAALKAALAAMRSGK